MTVITKTIQVKSAGEGDVINFTEHTSRMVVDSNITIASSWVGVDLTWHNR